MESLTSIFSTVNSPEQKNHDLWLWLFIFFIITDDIDQKFEKCRRQKQQKHSKLANQPKRHVIHGPKIF